MNKQSMQKQSNGMIEKFHMMVEEVMSPAYASRMV